MVRKFEGHTSARATKRNKRTKPVPTPQELADRYFDLQCLRQQVRIAETGQIFDRELTGSLETDRFPPHHTRKEG